MSARTGRGAASEAVLVRRVLRNLSQLGRVSGWGVELNAHGRSHIDVCALIDGEVLGIEAKLSDWRKAVGQAALNRYAVERSYIALEPARVSPAVNEVAAQYGVGVLSVTSTSLVVHQEAQLFTPDPRLRERVHGRLKTGRRA